MNPSQPEIKNVERQLIHPTLREKVLAINTEQRLEIFQLLELDAVLQELFTLDSKHPALEMDIAHMGKHPDVISYNSEGFFYAMDYVTVPEIATLISSSNVGVPDLIARLEKQITDKTVKEQISNIGKKKLDDYTEQNLLTDLQQYYWRHANRTFAEMDKIATTGNLDAFEQRANWLKKLTREGEIGSGRFDKTFKITERRTNIIHLRHVG